MAEIIQLICDRHLQEKDEQVLAEGRTTLTAKDDELTVNWSKPRILDLCSPCRHEASYAQILEWAEAYGRLEDGTKSHKKRLSPASTPEDEPVRDKARKLKTAEKYAPFLNKKTGLYDCPEGDKVGFEKPGALAQHHWKAHGEKLNA
jgi:hypothetical protein